MVWLFKAKCRSIKKLDQIVIIAACNAISSEFKVLSIFTTNSELFFLRYSSKVYTTSKQPCTECLIRYGKGIKRRILNIFQHTKACDNFDL